MEEEIIEAVNPKISDLNMHVDKVYLEEVDGITNLNVVLDSDEVIDLDRITLASNIINPIIDKMNIDLDNYVLDIHSKESGDDYDE